MSNSIIGEYTQCGCLEEFYRGLCPSRMVAGWRNPAPSAEPVKAFRPYRWSYGQAKTALDAAGRLINTELVERRNLILVNPSDQSGSATARTMMAAYQMIMPGERARAHRHTPSALRLGLTPK